MSSSTLSVRAATPHPWLTKQDQLSLLELLEARLASRRDQAQALVASLAGLDVTVDGLDLEVASVTGLWWR